MSSTPASVYSAEIAHPKLRGRVTLFTALFTSLGMLIVYTLGYFIPDNFRLVSLISGVFTIFSLFSVIPLPESPTWLVGKNRIEHAKSALSIFRGIEKDNIRYSEIENEIHQLASNLRKAKNESPNNTVAEILKQPEVHKPLIIMIIFFFFQQFSGTFVILVYGAVFVSEISGDINPFICTVLIGLIRLLTTLLLSFLSDKLGRRPLGMFSGIGMALCMISISFCLYKGLHNELNFIQAVLLLGFIFFATLGILTLPFSMIAEVFPQRYRGFCAGLTIFAGYTMSFVIIKLYPYMLLYMGKNNLYIFYGSISFIGSVFVYFILPETKGKSLQQIENSFRKHQTPQDTEMYEMKA